LSDLIEKLFAIHDSLAEANIAHAFGGAIALAYCTEEPRGTRDLDVNIFIDSAKAGSTLACMPRGVTVTDQEVATVERDGQARLDWDGTPIDVFLNNLPLHQAVATAVVWVPLAGRDIPVLDCASLAIFKALFDRTKDWADLEAIAQATPEDIDAAAATIADLLGAQDPAVRRLESLIPLDVGSSR
jgi:hypothetical protein